MSENEGKVIKDIGVMDGPVLVFGGPYSNLEATRALFEAAAEHHIPRDRIICTGDVVAYGAAPQETVELIATSGIHVIQGNCEVSLGASLEDCGCGFEEGSACDQLAARWYAYANANIGKDSRQWMTKLPAQITFEIAGRRLAVVHGAPSLVNEFVFAATPGDVKSREIDLTGCDGVICGHTGIPFTQIVEGRLWHNAGVIGMPANDGTMRTWYSLLWPQEDGLRIEHWALSYQAQLAAAAMRAHGLPTEYSDTIMSGLWDNCEILPASDVEMRGKPLSPKPTHWPVVASH